jgi:protein-S-isoprenylcysteine O-methyltransferase Ste14
VREAGIVSELLDALDIRGRRDRTFASAAMSVTFAMAMVAIAAAQGWAEVATGASAVTSAVGVAGTWFAWTLWHSVVFPRNRLRFLAGSPRPYRRAFATDIFLGISVGFSQMLRPVLNGETLKSLTAIDMTPSAALGSVVLVVATASFISAWRRLGTARVGFVHEYVDVGAFVPERRGIYGVVRHPLFWSGIAVSMALALIVGTSAAFAIGIVNVAYAVAYNRLEDRRLAGIFGPAYQTYAAEVAAIVPKAWPRRERDHRGYEAPSDLQPSAAETSQSIS